MKKFLTITLLTLVMMVFVACGGSSKKEKTDPTDEPTSEEPTNQAEEPSENPSEPTADEEDDGCTGISVDWSQLTMYQSNFFYLGEDPAVYLEFYQNENYTVSAGTYDLGTEDNTNYKTCSECVRYLTDYVEATDTENGHYNHIYFQKSGTLTIDGVDDNGNIKGTIAAKLIEVTIDPDEFTSTPVEGGACFKIESATFDSGWEEPCVPQCEGKKCGNDGCGGSCGTCKGQACSADFQCVPFDCKDIEFEDEAFELTGSTSYSATPLTTLGSPELEDSLQLRFYNEGIEKGTIDLGSEVNSNYRDCTECFLLLEDIDEDGYPSKIFFQESGELVFEDVKEDTYESKGHASLRLIEVEINSSDYSSIPVAGGKCYNVTNITWDTICVPQCDGKQCGSDGCGGTCGICDGQACSADFQCVPFNCDKIDVSEFELTEEEDWFGGISYYYDAYATGKGIGSESIPDLLEIAFIADELEKGTVTLTGDTENIGDAYVVLYEDYDTENYEIGKYYFQESGTLDFTEVKAGTFESKGTGSFRLIEVDDNFFAAAGGKCYEFENISWNTIK